MTPDNKFRLCWDDYGRCHRVVTFDVLKEVTGRTAPEVAGDGAWWNMGRRMTDLKAP